MKESVGSGGEVEDGEISVTVEEKGRQKYGVGGLCTNGGRYIKSN